MNTGKQPENKNLAYYCQRFSELKVNTSKERGDAPYKPILLLSVIELIAQGLIEENHITVTNQLEETFEDYKNTLSSGDFENDLSLPFFHLKNEKIPFWTIKFNDKYDHSRKTDNKIRNSINKLNEYVEYACIDDELFDLIQEPNSREELVNTLVSVWFSLSNKKIEDILKVNQAVQDSMQKRIKEMAESEKSEATAKRRLYLKQVAVRNAFFGKAVAYVYDYRCALCGLKAIRKINQKSGNEIKQKVVDGAHIKPFSRFYDNSINNGISLCKNHHWAFDNGWFSIDVIDVDEERKDYRILVASDLEEEFTNDLEEENRNAKFLKGFCNHKLLLPSLKKYWPSNESLQWHRKNVFKA
jgi:putative restriction endonuclease